MKLETETREITEKLLRGIGALQATPHHFMPGYTYLRGRENAVVCARPSIVQALIRRNPAIGAGDVTIIAESRERDLLALKRRRTNKRLRLEQALWEMELNG